MSKLAAPLIALAALSIPLASLAQSQPVQITAWAQHIGGSVVYRYEVRNMSASPLQRVLIGHFTHPSSGRAELSVQPSVSSSDDGSLWLPSDVATSPAGWGVAMIFPEESATFSLEWIDAELNRRLWPLAQQTRNAPVSIGTDAAIPPGGTSIAFSVRVPKVDAAYVSGSATVGYAEGSVTLPLRKGDNVPPLLHLTVDRLNQSGIQGHWAIFEASAAVSDNYDPAPTVGLSVLGDGVSLEPDAVDVLRLGMKWKIKLKNTPGHAYELRFTAEDASGNQSVESVRYPIP